MRVWVITEIHDDGDPGDCASLSSVRVFGTLQAARDSFWKERAEYTKDQKGYMHVDAFLEDLEIDFGPDVPEGIGLRDWANEQAMKEPERFRWTNGRDDDTGWEGGSMIEFTEAEVES